jgi:hypothetical protein
VLCGGREEAEESGKHCEMTIIVTRRYLETQPDQVKKTLIWNCMYCFCYTSAVACARGHQVQCGRS